MMPDKIDPMIFAPFRNRDRNFSPCIEQLFYAMDVNHDDRVSLDEFIAGYRQVLVFRSMDTDGNCEVSLQEAVQRERALRGCQPIGGLRATPALW